MSALYIKKNANFELMKSCPLKLNLNTHAADECRRPDRERILANNDSKLASVRVTSVTFKLASVTPICTCE